MFSIPEHVAAENHLWLIAHVQSTLLNINSATPFAPIQRLIEIVDTYFRKPPTPKWYTFTLAHYNKFGPLYSEEDISRYLEVATTKSAGTKKAKATYATQHYKPTLTIADLLSLKVPNVYETEDPTTVVSKTEDPT